MVMAIKDKAGGQLAKNRAITLIDAHRTGAARPLLPILRFVSPVIGLLIVYAFLAEPLGLTISRKGAKESA